MQTPVKKISILTVTLVASLGGFLFGFDMAVISGVLPLVQKQFNLSAFQEGWFVSVALVGCIVGVAFSGELADRIGRKKPLLLSAVLFLLSALGCAVAPRRGVEDVDPFLSSQHRCLRRAAEGTERG